MKRRDFTVRLAGAAFAATAQAAAPPVEGQQYVRLSTPLPVTLPPGKKVELIEFFWYECPHCFEFEPMLEAWLRKLPEDVYFHRVPVGFTARHQITQKLYYALLDMDQAEALHKKIFNAIHVQNQRLLSVDDMAAFVAANGADAARFRALYDSFQVSTQASKATRLADDYKIDGVPALGIQGRYYTSGALAGTYARTLETAGWLIARSR
ncbi:MAG: thiol:disulfide interchange protein DsbA/DsbL [Burkholderiales bacterium]|nr:thiol:disulfide interchange protein DsbA/DsbL [Burkholderiales bacterium]MDE2395891.1 thiol:disulfide interchange protein DsbA/DsbL [Burkholderiales bacterium]MDE2453844.1 thiol:disulfide interchange protein DsbA/DsbL [Burkholderiales bacterium]